VPLPAGSSLPERSAGAAPAPGLAANGTKKGAPLLAVSPVLGSGAKTPDHIGNDDISQGNPEANSHNDRAASRESDGVDFGPYMADLQRRIKQAWLPPKGGESKRVVVVFKIHRAGELSDLRLAQSCGWAKADQAALAAVEHAAPFRPLPKGAGSDVDIQFTFDYHVFDGSGTFRRF
jgi:TonB family protein